ncbi:aspartate--tRNA ligase [Candidatus Kaiserbacteria bacterium]|nr:aspartate--tRNA ligase [Candidatus Kaiserbacteria bacterium]
MERTFIKDLAEHVGESVLIKGWVSVRRDQGKMVFFDFRDMTGTVQGLVTPGSAAITTAKETNRESVVAVTATVQARPEKNAQPGKTNGTIELLIEAIEILSPAAVVPFEVNEDTSGIGEETRLAHRYLDLRSERMQRNIRLRSELVRRCREYLFGEMFTEIETPLLTESTPEGSRDFVVPSRLHPGKFYALPQSPQQYKQLLMVGGFERYFQIARAIRDEDLRADRGFEHTQIDIEMSFVTQEDVMNTVEAMVTQAVEAMGYTVKEKPFPRFTYVEAMEKFGADKFDLRTEEDKQNGVLAYAWVHRFPFFEKTPEGGWTFTHNPFSMPIPEHIGQLLEKKDVGEILTTQYDLVCNGYEAGGGSIRAHKPEILRAVYETMGYSAEETEERIGHMLKAFEFGVPPHGGIALGVERLIMNLTGETQLREVQAFPMTRGGQTSVMKAPKELTGEQLAELGIQIKPKPAS